MSWGDADGPSLFTVNLSALVLIGCLKAEVVERSEKCRLNVVAGQPGLLLLMYPQIRHDQSLLTIGYP